MTKTKEILAIFGGPKAVVTDPRNIFTWPIITDEDEKTVLDVLRRGEMSETKITEQFEKEFADWHGVKYALAHNNGTAALHGAMFGCRIGVGDEIICPSLTYWASCLPVFTLGGTVVFADIDPETLCINPADIEDRVCNRTKAIMVVHYIGMPCDMDPIMDIARKHSLKVIEDVSHAHGARYKGRLVGTIGDVGAMSFMSGKALPCGEGGALITNDREIYERALAFGHYERYGDNIKSPELTRFRGLPLGGYKYRINQLSSSVARIQLKHYQKRMEDIQKAMNYFWDILEGMPGIRPHRPRKDSGCTMGGWYAPHGLYRSEELDGLSVQRFAEAVTAEGSICAPGANLPLHLHPLFNECDIYGHGKPSRIANATRDVRKLQGNLPVSENLQGKTFFIPWFKHFYPEIIREHAGAFIKAIKHYEELIPGDSGDEKSVGSWGLFRH